MTYKAAFWFSQSVYEYHWSDFNGSDLSSLNFVSAHNSGIHHFLFEGLKNQDSEASLAHLVMSFML